MANRVLDIYQALFDHFGPQHWWPGDTPFEVMVGAVLTQNTNWRNVSIAIDTLKQQGVLSFEAMESMAVEGLALAIRPSGYYNQKARKLHGLLAAIRRESGDLDSFLALPAPLLREKLLAISGVGPETADSIILYAAGQPVFVVDAYTHRVFSRHNLIPEEISYHEIQDLFLANLPEDHALFNEYHALLVRVGKEYCRKTAPLCDGCPLRGM